MCNCNAQRGGHRRCAALLHSALLTAGLCVLDFTVSAKGVVAPHAHVYDQASGYWAGETVVVSVVVLVVVEAEAAGSQVYWVGWSFGFLRDKERLHG